MTGLSEIDGVVRAMESQAEAKRKRRHNHTAGAAGQGGSVGASPGPPPSARRVEAQGDTAPAALSAAPAADPPHRSIVHALLKVADEQRCGAGVVQEAVSYVLEHGLAACEAALVQAESEPQGPQVTQDKWAEASTVDAVGSLPTKNTSLIEPAGLHQAQPATAAGTSYHGAGDESSEPSWNQADGMERSTSVGGNTDHGEAPDNCARASAKAASIVQSHVDALKADLDLESDSDSEPDSEPDSKPDSEPDKFSDPNPANTVQQLPLQHQHEDQQQQRRQQERQTQEERARVLQEYKDTFGKRPHVTNLSNVGWQKEQVKAYSTNRELVGSHVEIFWPQEQRWFPGKVTGYEPDLSLNRTSGTAGGMHAIDYDDGEIALHDLMPGATQYRILDEPRTIDDASVSTRGQAIAADKVAAVAGSASKIVRQGKRKGSVDYANVTPPSSTTSAATSPHVSGKGTATGSRSGTPYATASVIEERKTGRTDVECPHCIAGCGKLLGHEGRHRTSSNRGKVRCDRAAPPAIPPTEQGWIGPQLLKQPVRKFFETLGTLDGIVCDVIEPKRSRWQSQNAMENRAQQTPKYKYTVQYSDGETEDLSYDELKPLLLKSWRERRRLWGYATDCDDPSPAAVVSDDGSHCPGTSVARNARAVSGSFVQKDIRQGVRKGQSRVCARGSTGKGTKQQQQSVIQPDLQNGKIRCLDGIYYDVEEICASRKTKGGKVCMQANAFGLRCCDMLISVAHVCGYESFRFGLLNLF